MNQHFYYLNFFRSVAALCVLFVHARCEIFSEYSLLNPSSQNLFTQLFYCVASFGPEGVMILFALSGFLVGGRNISAIQEGRVSLGRYCINRASRLFPPLLGALVLSSSVKLIKGSALSAWSLFGNMFGLQCIAPGVGDEVGVLWTIPYEVWFYVLVASLICFFQKNKHFVVGCVLLAISVSMFLRMSTQFVWILMAGALGYFVRDYVPRSKSFFVSCVGLLVVTKAIGLMANAGRAYQGPLTGIVDGSILQWIMGSLFLLMIIRCAVAVPHTAIQRFFDKVGDKLAPFSYSLFLTHFSVLELFHHFFGHRPEVDGWGIMIFVAESLVCIVVAYVFYWLIEKRTKWMEKKLASLLKAT